MARRLRSPLLGEILSGRPLTQGLVGTEQFDKRAAVQRGAKALPKMRAP